MTHTSCSSLPKSLSSSLKMGIEAFTFISNKFIDRFGAGVGIVVGIQHTPIIKKSRGNVGMSKSREPLLLN